MRLSRIIDLTRQSFEMSAESISISPNLHVIEQHDQLLEIWRAEDATGLRIVHLVSL